jgi:hypothetical protein
MSTADMRRLHVCGLSTLPCNVATTPLTESVTVAPPAGALKKLQRLAKIWAGPVNGTASRRAPPSRNVWCNFFMLNEGLIYVLLI